ncbi:MAG: glycosyltransferase family 1 protein [Pleurocapsa sp. SU_5_0]|nr:glycosyltransferase family 1 protein [Pleurocapsa sp. SU_5_0]NJO95013.1 glycosyltransferase family 1 protein [Pleurocapsa sp. CRU_1_2]NJR46365.1 glycosyltransferase family 1 protein [Hyellaceae cyanobacterium CSU_1_1]
MKIAIICSSFFPVIDGVTIAIFKRLEQLSLLKHQVIVFCPDYSPIKHIYPDYEQYTGEIFPGIEIINLPSSKAIALDFERDLTIKSYQIVLEKLGQFKPDLIHVDEAERLGICLLKLPGVKYAQQHQIPCLAWFHTNYIDYLDDYFTLPLGINKFIKKILALIFVKIYNSYDCTLVSSSITAHKLKRMGIKNIAFAELLGCDLNQFRNSHQAVDFFTIKYNLPNLANKIKLIFIGRLTPDKGWNFVLTALAKLPAHIYDQIAIIIAGDGSLKTEIKRTLKQLTPEVYLLGRISPTSISELLVNGDIFITNSEKETKGLTVIEAAAAGIPAIAPRAGGVTDTIIDGETGWLYEPQNQADFLDKLTRLIADTQLRQSMGMKAQELAQQYSWQQTVNNLVEIWQQKI